MYFATVDEDGLYVTLLADKFDAFELLNKLSVETKIFLNYEMFLL